MEEDSRGQEPAPVLTRVERVSVQEETAIVDIDQMYDRGLLVPGKRGGCYTNHKDNDTACVICNEEDKCIRRTLQKYNSLVIEYIPEYIAETKQKKKKVYIPEKYEEFDLKVKALTPQILRIDKDTLLLYTFRTKRFIATVEPIQENNITVVLFNCTLDDFNDPKQLLWVGNTAHPDRPYMFVSPENIDYAFGLIKQLYKRIKKTFDIISKDKFKDVKRQIKDSTIPSSEIVADIRSSKGSVKAEIG